MHHPALRLLAPLLFATCVTWLGGCGGEESQGGQGAAGARTWPKGWPADSERVLKEGHAPTPYTAAQIREACAPGREDVMHLVEKGKSTWLRLRFTGGTEELAEFEIGPATSAEQPPSAWMPQKQPWAALQEHASTPADKTVVTFERVQVVAGAFDAALYTITGEADGKPKVTRHWFAFTLPGPPVKSIVTVGGETVSTSELLKTTRTR